MYIKYTKKYMQFKLKRLFIMTLYYNCEFLHPKKRKIKLKNVDFKSTQSGWEGRITELVSIAMSEIHRMYV